ncbi:MAG: hypothetical protein ACN4GG_04010 [Akkermansiaceae bacterium]
MPNPFGSTFESFGIPRGPLVEKVHQEQFETLSSLLEDGEGPLISLRAPRAGYGKTMLLSRLQQSRQAQTVFIPVRLADGCRVEGEMILEEILTQMSEVLPEGGGLTRLDLCIRKLFAQGLVPMVHSGEVPCQDREGALRSLRDRPAEAFDFHDEGAMIAQWSRKQFALLGPRLSSVLSKSNGATCRDTSYWTDLFFNYATRVPEDVSRTSDLMETVFGLQSRFRRGARFIEGLSVLINLITVVEPMVMVLDEVEGLSSDPDSALRVASCLTSLSEAAPRLSVVLSINDDIWDSAFAPRLPLGLKDRLEDIVVRLDSLSVEDARALVTVRAGDEAAKVLQHLDLENGELYPRDVLRKARAAWEKRDEQVAPQVVKGPELVEPTPDDSAVAELPKPEVEQAPQAAAEIAPSVEDKAPEPPSSVHPNIFRKHPSAILPAGLEGEINDDFVLPVQQKAPAQPIAPPFSASPNPQKQVTQPSQLPPPVQPQLQGSPFDAASAQARPR